jgi:hypothetical protein
MFRHVVMFKWNPGTPAETVKEVTDGLTACGRALAVTRSYTCGPDVQTAGGLAGAEDRFDFAIVADFDDEAGWRVYDQDPEHNRLRAELIRPLVAHRMTVQFETP